MKLERTLAREIETACGTTEEEKFAFARKADAVAKELSTTNARQIFPVIFKRHSRAAVAICVAATILIRRDHLAHTSVEWAQEVMKHYTNRISSLGRFYIRDELHPSRIEEYAGFFIRLTTE